jgi:hypothetical protein
LLIAAVVSASAAVMISVRCRSPRGVLGAGLIWLFTSLVVALAVMEYTGRQEARERSAQLDRGPQLAPTSPPGR